MVPAPIDVATRGVADVGEVVGLGARRDLARFSPRRNSDVHLFAEGRAGQARIRADAATHTDVGLVDVAEGLDAAALGDLDVAQHAIGADADAFAEHDLALEGELT